jgi:hypothetical protein
VRSHLSSNNSLFITRALWQIAATTTSSESEESWREMAMNIADEISLSYSAEFFNNQKAHDMRPTALLSLRRKSYYWFVLPLQPIVLCGFEPANLGPNDKHNNHWTTEADSGARRNKFTHFVFPFVLVIFNELGMLFFSVSNRLCCILMLRRPVTCQRAMQISLQWKLRMRKPGL